MPQADDLDEAYARLASAFSGDYYARHGHICPQAGVRWREALYDLSQADTVCDHVRALTVIDGAIERLLEEGVRNAREDGYSWAEIGVALEVTKQSAWRKYARNVRSSTPG